MTENEARAWLVETRHVSRETIEKLEVFSHLVIAESRNQNLISAATVDQIWARHIVDSAQLAPLMESAEEGPCLDLGSGAGFPGIVLALTTNRPLILVESRRKRIDFLTNLLEKLDISGNAIVFGGRLELYFAQPVAVITARAFAPLSKLFDLAQRFSHNETVWLLPKGRSAREELENIGHSWQGVFHVEQSITDPESSIIVARHVHRR
jgi:16S rRNA (guanine527-N7)-methyltransferase